MFLSVNGRYLELHKDSELYIGENALEKVQNYKYLGIWMDVNLDLDYHMEVQNSYVC